MHLHLPGLLITAEKLFSLNLRNVGLERAEGRKVKRAALRPAATPSASSETSVSLPSEKCRVDMSRRECRLVSPTPSLPHRHPLVLSPSARLQVSRYSAPKPLFPLPSWLPHATLGQDTSMGATSYQVTALNVVSSPSVADFEPSDPQGLSPGPFRQIVKVGERESIQWGTPESELLREAVSIVLDFGLIT